MKGWKLTYLLYGIFSSTAMNLAKEVCVTVRGTILPFIPFRPSLQSTQLSVQWAKRTPLLVNSGRSRNWTTHNHLSLRRSILLRYIFTLKHIYCVGKCTLCSLSLYLHRRSCNKTVSLTLYISLCNSAEELLGSTCNMEAPLGSSDTA
jgi:hypothetical protein